MTPEILGLLGLLALLVQPARLECRVLREFQDLWARPELLEQREQQERQERQERLAQLARRVRWAQPEYKAPKDL